VTDGPGDDRPGAVPDVDPASDVDPVPEADLTADDPELKKLLSVDGEPEALTELSDTAKKFLDDPDVDAAG
jgi:hypothetical protein